MAVIESRGRPVLRDGVQCFSEDVIIDLVPTDSFPGESFSCNILKEIGEEIEPMFDKAQAVDRHGLDNLRVAQAVVTAFL